MKTKGKMFLAALTVLAMAFVSISVMDVSEEVSADPAYDYLPHTPETIRVYVDNDAYEADADRTGGMLMSLNEALAQANYTGQVWLFKPGVYNVTYRSVGVDGGAGKTNYNTYGTGEGAINCGSVLVIKKTVTLVGAVDGAGAPATTLYADYAALGYADRDSIVGGYMNDYFTANDLIWIKGTVTNFTMNNMSISPLVYYSDKYSGLFGIPNGAETRWYTPNCTITSSATGTVTLDNIKVTKNTLGVKDAAYPNNVYMLDDGGNCQSLSASTWVVSNFVTYGGFGLDKAVLNMDMKNVTMNFGGQDAGDMRTIKFKHASSAFGASDQKITVNIKEVENCKSSPKAELQTKLLADSNPDLPAGTVINLYCNAELDSATKVPAGVTLNVYGTLDVTATTVNNLGTINCYGTINGTENISGNPVVDKREQPVEIDDTTTADDGSTADVTAEVKETTAEVSFDNIVGETVAISDEVAQSIVDAAEAAGNTIDVGVSSNTQSVQISPTLYTSEAVKSVTVAVNQNSANKASITIPKDAIAPTGNVTLSVKPVEAPAAPAADIGDSTSTGAFELTMTGADFVAGKTVRVSVDVEIPANAKNVRFVCLDNGDSTVAQYAGGTASADLPHFSIWAIVYDLAVDNSNNDVINLINQINAANNKKPVKNDMDTIVVAVVAAAAAIMALACFMVLRRN